MADKLSYLFPNDENLSYDNSDSLPAEGYNPQIRTEILAPLPDLDLLAPYRPQTLEEYVGQVEAKSIIESNIRGVLKRNAIFPHTLIYGQAGTGKTTLARIVANILKKPFKEMIISSLNTEINLIKLIHEVDGGILFVDEIHSLTREMCESIYSPMADFKLNGVSIKPFTLMGATTEYGELLETRRPFVDRFEIQIELEDYTIDDLIILLRQYKNKAFPLEKVSPKHYGLIAENARANPRTSIRFLKGSIYLDGDIKTLFRNYKILKEGYTRKDLKVLKYIASNDKGVGLQGISAYLGTSDINYLQDIEPYLLKKGLLVRAPRGRKISLLGLEKIKELEKG